MKILIKSADKSFVAGAHSPHNGAQAGLDLVGVLAFQVIVNQDDHGDGVSSAAKEVILLLDIVIKNTEFVLVQVGYQVAAAVLHCHQDDHRGGGDDDLGRSLPWPRDLRGRLIPAKDHLLDVYLPGVICRSGAAAPLTLNCRETDDPWPLVPAALSGGTFSGFPGAGSTAVAISPLGAFYAPTRNFFTGALTSGIGKFTIVPKFYSAAFLPRDKYLLWLFAATDGHVHMIDGINDQAARFDWGSDLTNVKTSCGASWQVLATSPEEGTADSVRAYEFPDRDPVAVSTAIDFPGSGVSPRCGRKRRATQQSQS